MITKLDTSKLDARHKKTPMRGDLEQFIDDVALIKPKAKFAIDNDCVAQDYVINQTTNQYDRNEVIYRVKVFEEGEEIGALMVYEEYRHGKKVPTYGVESFRIQKFRGRGNTTTSMHKKVALSNAKKSLVARVKDELVEQIKNNVTQRLGQLASNCESQLTWSINQTNLARDYAVAAYHARQSGTNVVTLEASSSKYSSNIKNVDKLATIYLDLGLLNSMAINGKGYGVQTYTDGSCAIYSFATGDVSKYQTFDEIPQDISEKLAMFKIISQDEAYPHLGVKLLDHLYFIVDGKTQVDA